MDAAREPLARLAESEGYVARLRGPLLYYFGTTDPDLLAEMWADSLMRLDRTADALSSPSPEPDTHG